MPTECWLFSLAISIRADGCQVYSFTYSGPCGDLKKRFTCNIGRPLESTQIHNMLMRDSRYQIHVISNAGGPQGFCWAGAQSIVNGGGHKLCAEIEI